MTSSGIRRAALGEVEIAYETFGDPQRPPVLLVMGLATQMLGWPDEFCAELAGRGLFVVRFDNRDVGLSTHLHDTPPPDLGAAFAGEPSQASYLLSDMARDAVGLIDALGLDGAHLVGASMGGMIAQAAAIEHPERVRSLTSIMSTTGDRTVGGATDAAMAALLSPPASDREGAVRRAVDAFRVVGSPGFEFDEQAVRDRAGLSYDRAYDPAGVARQLVAVLTSGDRTQALRSVGVPTLVIHGAADPLVDVSGGRATAAAVPDAELLVVDGMGHDLPREVWPRLVDRIATLVERAEACR